MAGLDPAIHVFISRGAKDVDARHKAGHDESSIDDTPLGYAETCGR
jgi:DNA replication and repair protein RecF